MDDFRSDKPDEQAVTETSANVEPTPDTNTYQSSVSEPATEPVAAPVAVTSGKKSNAKTWLLAGLAVILLAAAGAFAYLQWVDANNARDEAVSLKTQLQAAQTQQSKEAAAPTDDEVTSTPKGEDFSAFVLQYDAIQAASVPYTDVDMAAIQKGIKEHYKLTTLPADWAILAVYKDAKADATTGKPLNALIYWPKSSEKPAGFFEMNQKQDGAWIYNDLR